MKNATALTCYLIGEEQLLIDCVKILKSYGADIKGIISRSESIRLWARKHDISCVDCLAQIQWDRETVDYLFSICSHELIPPTILAKVFYGTVVYHDSLLPRYAGAHATAWAILNQETSHGISWHLANGMENGGVILSRTQIDVEPGATAHSLQLRCLAWAVTTFGELVAKLRSHALKPVAQDLAQRTWFGPDQKPWGNGWIDWKYTAEEIECYWRATQFGAVANTFTTLKMICAGEALVIESLRILPVSSDGLPGKVVAITKDHWQIITGSSDLLIVIDLRKSAIRLRADVLAIHCNLKVNDQLTSPDPEQLQQFQTLSEQCASAEVGWVQTLKQFHATPVESNVLVVGRRTLPETLHYHLLDFSRKSAELPLVLLTAWLVYLFRLRGQCQISLCLLIEQPQICVASRPFFPAARPYSFTVSGQDNFVQQLDRVRQTFEAQRLQKPYLFDLWHRYPELTDIVLPEQQSVSVDMDFEGGVVVAATEQLPDAFASLCTQLLHHTNVPVGEIEWLNKKDKQKILVDWNATDTVYPEHKTIHRLFEEQVYKTPQQLALITEDSVLTYHELNCRVNQLAHYLITFHAVKPDEPVAVYLERGPDILIAELGILKAGGACLPLDPNWPASTIARILKDSQANSLITTEMLLRRLHQSTEFTLQGRQMLILDSPLSALMLAQQSVANTRVPVKSDQLAFLFYGGQNRLDSVGVALEHRGIVNQMIWLNELSPLTPEDRILQYASSVAHYSLLEFFWAASFGATIVSSNDDNQCEPEYLCKLIEEKQVTVVQLVAVTLQALMQYLSGRSVQLGALRHIFCHGPELDINTRRAIRTLLPWVRLHFLYGAVETSVHVLHAQGLEPQEILAGRPISNVRAYVLDEKLHPVPVGVRGELHIAGDGLARGYVNQPELTRQRFIPNPFQTDQDKKTGRHARLYKTGDWLYWLPGGQFGFGKKI